MRPVRPGSDTGRVAVTISLPVRNLLTSNLVNVFLVNYIPPVASADAVDAILDQWQRERPDLDVTSTGVFGRISRIAALVDQAMDRVFQPHGLTGGDFVVLAALRRSGTPYQLTPTALTRSMMVTSGGTTKRLDRLEVRGLIRRDPDPADRRGTLVTLTEAGLTTIDAVAPEHVQNEQRLLAALSPNQRDTLTQLLRELLLALEHG